MPISATSADAAPTPPWGAPTRVGGLLLDYGSRDKGPFRAALLQAGAAPSPAHPGAAQAIVPPAASELSPAPVLEGADALAALSRDLASGARVDPAETATAPGYAAAVAPDTVDPAAADAAPSFTESWRNDEIKGRRLGDRPVPVSSETGVESWLFGADGFGFDDLLDVVNPLQHIPVVSSLYRWITGDEIAPAASVAGGALFGGPLGAAGAMAGIAVAEATGRDLGEHALALMFGDEDAGATPPVTDLAGAPAGISPTDPAPPAAPAAFLPLPAADRPAPQLAGVAPAVQPTRAFAGGIPASDLPAVGAPVAFIPAVGSGAPDPSATGGGSESPVDAAIATQMMDALDKYEALVRARVGSAPSIEPAAGSLYDGHI